jgi:short-subunit dehydrogenase
MQSFHEKVACITGAGSGIGQALAIALAQKGCHLCLSDLHPEPLNHTALQAQQAAEDTGHTIIIQQTKVDVAQRAQVYAWAEHCVQHHGRVNLIINNAGLAYASPIEAIDYDHFEHIMNVNFWGVVYGTKAFLPHLKTAGHGHIVNMSSVFGLFAQPTQSPYNASKFAIRGFTESLRQELDLMNCGVSASCVLPGGIQTNIVKNSIVSPALEGFLGNTPNEPQLESKFMASATQAAHIILKGIQRNKRRILVGPDAWALDTLVRTLPQAHQALVMHHLKKQRKSD